jgi:lysozyme
MGIMTISNQGAALIKQQEGLRLMPYSDTVGVWTIGYGHQILPSEHFPNGITEQQANSIFWGDVICAENHVNDHVTIPMSQGEFDALVDFVYNLGDRLPGSTLLKLLNAGQIDAAEQELQKWDFAGGKPCAALKARRVLEMGLWAKGNAG